VCELWKPTKTPGPPKPVKHGSGPGSFPNLLGHLDLEGSLMAENLAHPYNRGKSLVCTSIISERLLADSIPRFDAHDGEETMVHILRTVCSHNTAFPIPCSK
jgi:hypothetical protein